MDCESQDSNLDWPDDMENGAAREESFLDSHALNFIASTITFLLKLWIA